MQRSPSSPSQSSTRSQSIPIEHAQREHTKIWPLWPRRLARLLLGTVLIVLPWVRPSLVGALQNDYTNASPQVQTRPLPADTETPIAHAGDAQHPYAGTTVILDGSSSSDPDGDFPLTYRWRQVGGPVVQLSSTTMSVTTFTAPALPTVLGFYLYVTDSQGHESAPDAVVVTVIDSPLAGLETNSDTPTAIGSPTLFTATISGSSAVTYTWDFGDGITTTGNLGLVSHVYSQTGRYEVTLIANADGVTAIQQVVVIVYNPAPISQASVSPTVALAGSVVQLDALASYDPNNNLPLSYTWVQVEGPRVVLTHSNSATPEFIAPASPTTATLSFYLAVIDAYDTVGQPYTVTMTLLPSLVAGPTDHFVFLPVLMSKP